MVPILNLLTNMAEKGRTKFQWPTKKNYCQSSNTKKMSIGQRITELHWSRLMSENT